MNGGFTLKELIVLCVLVQLLVLFFLPNFIHTGCGGQVTACKSNLKNVATALEMYAEDHGRFPATISGSLTPNYLKCLPTCPTAGRVTYIDGYLATEERYFISCYGLNHEGVDIKAPHYPRYSSVEGLVERP